jgi:flap endonuclease-1
VREVPLSSLQGRKIAIDASMAIYQFLIAVRSQNGAGGQAMQLTNADGETTSHVQGLFNRTIRFLTEGIRPVYIFDGKPPTIKSGELGKRREKREKAEAALKVAEEDGNIEEQDRQNKRLVRAGQKENEDCRRLLELMGIPVIRAPCEAEAQAAALAQRGLVYAAATEDMDALTFRTPVLLRKMTFANASKAMIQTINYQKALEGLELDHGQFVDLCILMGCDYCDSIKGIGPKTALKMIREYKNMETLLSKIDRKKYSVPQSWEPNAKRTKTAENYDTDEENNDDKDDDENTMEEMEPIYVQARRLFNHHDVLESPEIKFKPCQPEELTRFLVDEMGFNPERVKSNIEKLQKAFQSSAKPQARMDSFFKVIPNPVGEKKNKTTTTGKNATNKKNGFFGKRKR